MAINRILNPVAAATPPTGTTGYTYQNNVLEALAENSNQGWPVDGTNIVKGSLFYIQGVWYRADSTTAITGTESEYVKITPSGATATAAFVSSLSGVTWDDDYNGYYDGSGNLYIFDETISLQNGLKDYIRYNKAKIDGLYYSLITVGDKFTLDESGEFAVLSDTRICVVGAEINIYDWDGSLWSKTGTGTAISNTPTVAAMTSTRIAIIDDVSNTITAYDYAAGSWSGTGSSGTVVQNNVAPFPVSSTRVGFVSDTDNVIKIWDFDGSNWTETGSGTYTGSNTQVVSLSSIKYASPQRIYDLSGSSISESSITTVETTSSMQMYKNSTSIVGIDGDGAMFINTFTGVDADTQYIGRASIAGDEGTGFKAYKLSSTEIVHFTGSTITTYKLIAMPRSEVGAFFE